MEQLGCLLDRGFQNSLTMHREGLSSPAIVSFLAWHVYRLGISGEVMPASCNVGQLVTVIG